MKTLHCMSRHNQRERDSAVAQFNDPDTSYTCLISSLQLSAFGVNFHKACHRGIIVESPINLSHELQALGRLYRIGQREEVEWKILLCRDSFDSCFETRSLAKFVTTLVAEGQMPAQIQGENRVICAWEILRAQLGQACSRYPRTRAKWNEMDGVELYREGLFYSALAQWMLANPDQSHAHDRQQINRIALSWEPGTPLTADHINQEREPLPEGRGVILKDRTSDEEDQAPSIVDEAYASEDEAAQGESKETASEEKYKRNRDDESPGGPRKKARTE